MKGYYFGIALIVLGIAGVSICPALGMTLDTTKYVCIGVVVLGGIIEIVSMRFDTITKNIEN